MHPWKRHSLVSCRCFYINDYHPLHLIWKLLLSPSSMFGGLSLVVHPYGCDSFLWMSCVLFYLGIPPFAVYFYSSHICKPCCTGSLAYASLWGGTSISLEKIPTSVMAGSAVGPLSYEIQLNCCPWGPGETNLIYSHSTLRSLLLHIFTTLEPIPLKYCQSHRDDFSPSGFCLFVCLFFIKV